MKMEPDELAILLSSPHARQEMLKEHDIEVTVGPIPPGGEEGDQQVTIRKVIDPDGNYLAASIKPDSSELPAFFVIPGSLIEEFSVDGNLLSGVRRHLDQMVSFSGDGSEEVVVIEVYKLQNFICQLEGKVDQGKFVEKEES